MNTMKLLHFRVMALICLFFPVPSFVSAEQVGDTTIEGMTCQFSTSDIQKNGITNHEY